MRTTAAYIFRSLAGDHRLEADGEDYRTWVSDSIQDPGLSIERLRTYSSAFLIAARARIRVESSVGREELPSPMISGISVQPSTTASQP